MANIAFLYLNVNYRRNKIMQIGVRDFFAYSKNQKPAKKLVVDLAEVAMFFRNNLCKCFYR